jgi:hypothetical protein
MNGAPFMISSAHAIPIPDCKYGLNDTQRCCVSPDSPGCGTRTGCLDPNAQGCPRPDINETLLFYNKGVYAGMTFHILSCPIALAGTVNTTLLAVFCSGFAFGYSVGD